MKKYLGRMKKILGWVGIIAVAVSSASAASSASPTRATPKRQLGEGGAGGGNGRPHSVYTSMLGLYTVQYDPELQVTEKEDGSVVICNAAKATGQETKECIESQDPSKPVSRVSFRTQAKNGKSLREHAKHLPAEKLTATKVGPYEALVYSPSGSKAPTPGQSGQLIQMTYWIELSAETVLEADVQAYDYAEGRALILPILTTLTVDRKAPVLLAVDLPSLFVAGEKPSIVRFQAKDDLSGIPEGPHGDYPEVWFFFNRLQTTPSGIDYFTEKGGFADNLELFGSVKRENDDWYSLTVSRQRARGRVAGTYVLTGISIVDSAHNSTSYRLPHSKESITDMAYCGKELQKPLLERFYCVNSSERPGLEWMSGIRAVTMRYMDEDGEDLTAPIVKRMQTDPGAVIRFENGKPVNSDFGLKLEIEDEQNPCDAPFRITADFYDTSRGPDAVRTFMVELRTVPLFEDRRGNWYRVELVGIRSYPASGSWFPLNHLTKNFEISYLHVMDRSGNTSHYQRRGFEKFYSVISEDLSHPMRYGREHLSTDLPIIQLAMDTDDPWEIKPIEIFAVKVNPEWNIHRLVGAEKPAAAGSAPDLKDAIVITMDPGSPVADRATIEIENVDSGTSVELQGALKVVAPESLPGAGNASEPTNKYEKYLTEQMRVLSTITVEDVRSLDELTSEQIRAKYQLSNTQGAFSDWLRSLSGYGWPITGFYDDDVQNSITAKRKITEDGLRRTRSLSEYRKKLQSESAKQTVYAYEPIKSETEIEPKSELTIAYEEKLTEQKRVLSTITVEDVRSLQGLTSEQIRAKYQLSENQARFCDWLQSLNQYDSSFPISYYDARYIQSDITLQLTSIENRLKQLSRVNGDRHLDADRLASDVPRPVTKYEKYLMERIDVLSTVTVEQLRALEGLTSEEIRTKYRLSENQEEFCDWLRLYADWRPSLVWLFGDPTSEILASRHSELKKQLKEVKYIEDGVSVQSADRALGSMSRYEKYLTEEVDVLSTLTVEELRSLEGLTSEQIQAKYHLSENQEEFCDWLRKLSKGQLSGSRSSIYPGDALTSVFRDEHYLLEEKLTEVVRVEGGISARSLSEVNSDPRVEPAAPAEPKKQADDVSGSIKDTFEEYLAEQVNVLSRMTDDEIRSLYGLTSEQIRGKYHLSERHEKFSDLLLAWADLRAPKGGLLTADFRQHYVESEIRLYRLDIEEMLARVRSENQKKQSESSIRYSVHFDPKALWALSSGRYRVTGVEVESAVATKRFYELGEGVLFEVKR